MCVATVQKERLACPLYHSAAHVFFAFFSFCMAFLTALVVGAALRMVFATDCLDASVWMARMTEVCLRGLSDAIT